jgi:hypothetical protein
VRIEANLGITGSESAAKFWFIDIFRANEHFDGSRDMRAGRPPPCVF